MERALTWLSGALPEVLARSPNDRGQYLGLGSSVLVAAVIVGTGVGAALHTGLIMPLAGAIPVAVVVAVAVMGLDRWLVTWLRRSVSLRAYLAVGVPRILLGALSAVSITILVLMSVARPQIDKQVVVIQQHNISNYFASISHGALGRRIAFDRQFVSSLQSKIDISANPSLDPHVKDLDIQLTSAQATENVDYSAWQCQLYGQSVSGHACSTPSGNGPLAKLDQQRYEQDVGRVASLQQSIVTLTSNDKKAGSSAAIEMPAAEQALQTDNTGQEKITAAFTKSNSNAGVLIRLQAMEDASARGWADIARWMLVILLIIFACLPILLKFMLNIGPETAYEKLMALDLEEQLQAARKEKLRIEAVKNAEAGTTIKEVQRLLADWETKIPETRDEALAIGRRLASAMMRDWENRKGAERPPRNQ